jgi:hypothetical protein
MGSGRGQAAGDRSAAGYREAVCHEVCLLERFLGVVRGGD